MIKTNESSVSLQRYTKLHQFKHAGNADHPRTKCNLLKLSAESQSLRFHTAIEVVNILRQVEELKAPLTKNLRRVSLIAYCCQAVRHAALKI